MKTQGLSLWITLNNYWNSVWEISLSLILHSRLYLDLSDRTEVQITICAMVSALYLRKDPLTLLEFCLFLPVMTVTAFITRIGTLYVLLTGLQIFQISCWQKSLCRAQ